ncbi:MAG: leucine-rich repeat protein [Ruminococcus sp.]|nr:leucine-rich repeat protein [Ruminococcus sp.]
MNFKRILAAAMCLCITAPMAVGTPVSLASAVTVDNSVKTEIHDIYMYKNYGDHVEICAVSTTSEGDIIVPETIDGVTVTDVGEHGLAGASKITSVTLPDTVTVIGKQAFSGCTALKTVNIPSGVTAIGDEAFLNCLSLESIKLPDNLTSIGVRSFYNCQKLTKIDVPDSVSSMGEGAFSSCTGLESFKIPSAVTALADTVLNGCKSITELTLPKNVEKIGMMSLPSSLDYLTIDNPDFATDNLLMNLNKNCVLVLPKGSSVIEFAQENGITFEVGMQCVEVLGDVNYDWEFTIADLVMMSEYLLGKGSLESFQLGDMNNDGAVDVYDLVLMRQEYVIAAPQTYTATNLSKSVQAAEVNGKEADEEFILGQTDFAVSLFQKEVKEGENVMISPYSVMQALAMTANGADGGTKTEMENVLGGMPMDTLNEYLYTQRVSQSDTENCSLKTANSIWARDGRIKVFPEFLQKNADYYGADVFNAPFDDTTVTDINNWVNTNTDEMIPELIDTIADDTVMYLINAVAFEAEWEEKYKKDSIGTYDFTAFDGTVQSREMMSSSENCFISDENSTGFVKNYKGGKYAFAAILPNEGISVNDYISGLTAESFNSLLANRSYERVYTRLPKFSYEYDTSLYNTLVDMGMPSAFKPDADFTKLGETLTGMLCISDVLHKTFISVDEAGTKAGAVTSVIMSDCTAVPIPPIEVILDRPFIYCIFDTETNIPVFIGTVNSIPEK